MKYWYRIFGLIVESDLELPDLIPASKGAADINITFGHVPSHLPIRKDHGVLYEAYPGDFLFRLNSIGAYRVQNGNTIIISPNDDVPNEEIRLFLLSSVVAALLHQRGEIVLHGCAIEINNYVNIFMGRSSSGKSSIAAAFYKRGFNVLSDDITVLRLNKHGQYFAELGIPYIKLWKDVLEYLKNSEDLKRMRPQIEKYKKPIDHSLPYISKPINKLIYLSTKNSKGFSYEQVKGSNKFDLLRKQTYRPQYIDGLGQTTIQYKNLTKLANNQLMYILDRPNSPILLDELIDFYLSKIGLIDEIR